MLGKSLHSFKHVKIKKRFVLLVMCLRPNNLNDFLEHFYVHGKKN